MHCKVLKRSLASNRNLKENSLILHSCLQKTFTLRSNHVTQYSVLFFLICSPAPQWSAPLPKPEGSVMNSPSLPQTPHSATPASLVLFSPNLWASGQEFVFSPPSSPWVLVHLSNTHTLQLIHLPFWMVKCKPWAHSKELSFSSFPAKRRC